MQTIQRSLQLIPLRELQRPKPHVAIHQTTTHGPAEPPQTQRMNILNRAVPLAETIDFLITHDFPRVFGRLVAVAPFLAEGPAVGTQTLDVADFQRFGVFFVLDDDAEAFVPDGSPGRGRGRDRGGGVGGGGDCGGGDGGGEGFAGVEVWERG